MANSFMEIVGHWFRFVFMGFLVLLCAACLYNGPSDPTSLIAKLDAELPTAAANGNSPSIQVAVVHQGQIVWSQAFGENSSTDYVYMNASVQKSFTAAAILQLVERGLVDLDTDVSEYVPFVVRHPRFPETPITVRMLLVHRSGLDSFPNQFAWDTESTFSPKYRPPCPDQWQAMSTEEFLIASLTPDGLNYDEQAWIHEPGQAYHYSVSAYPFLRYLISQVAGQSYAEYMHENIFDPLGMSSSGFSTAEFDQRHAIPYTRINGENIEIPIWDGKASMMHSTAGDMAKFLIAFINNDQYEDFTVLQPQMIELMQERTSRFKVLFKSSDDLPAKGYGMGLFAFRGGWFGSGGSAPGFQCLMRFHPSRQVGFVILSNVNAILGGGKNYKSARHDIYIVQDALVSILDPTFAIRHRAGELGVIGGFMLYFFALGLWTRWRKTRKRNSKHSK